MACAALYEAASDLEAQAPKTASDQVLGACFDTVSNRWVGGWWSRNGSTGNQSRDPPATGP